MLTTESRFVVTHAGSLPRPAALAALHGRRSRGEAVDPDELRAAVEAATADVIARQVAAGIDVGNDGEQARESFFTYVRHRMTGFGGTSRRPVMRDLLEHPDFLELARPRRERMQVDLMHAPAAIGDVTYGDTGELDAECALVAGAPFAETFMTAPSPGIVVSAMENRHYPSRERVRRAPSPRRCAPSTARSSTAACCCRSTPPTWRWSATCCSPTARSASSSAGSSWSSTPSTAHSRASTRRGSGCTCAGATTRARTPTTSTLDDDPAAAVRGARRRARRVDGQRPPRPRAPLLRPPPAARRDGARHRRDRHDEQLRRAPGGRRRPARRPSPSRSAIRAA